MHYNRITDASRALHFAPTPHKSTTVEFAAVRASLEVSAHTQRPTSLLTGAGWSVDTLAHFSESSALADGLDTSLSSTTGCEESGGPAQAGALAPG